MTQRFELFGRPPIELIHPAQVRAIAQGAAEGMKAIHAMEGLTLGC